MTVSELYLAEYLKARFDLEIERSRHFREQKSVRLRRGVRLASAVRSGDRLFSSGGSSV